jgi:hypothetical protein
MRKAPRARCKEEKCLTKRCLNRKAFKKTYYRSKTTGKLLVYEGYLPYCWKCYARQKKEKHPATYVLNALRGRARQRKIPFTITLVEFQLFCEETGYLEKRGREADSLTIDRIDHDKGYHLWNLKVTPFLENCTNGHTVPGRDCKQNEAVPEVFDYDFGGPYPQNVVEAGQPF